MSELKNSPVEDFDWDAYENGESNIGRSRDELTHAYEESLNSIKDKEVIEGTIIALNKREAVVNIDYKSDGIIPMSEFRYNPDIKVGDTVEVFIENQEDRKGQLILSHKKARASRSWERINAALENDEIIKGYIKCRTKGGMIVDVFGIEAFLPGSPDRRQTHPRLRHLRWKDNGIHVSLRSTKSSRNVVVSHKALIEAELEAAETRDHLQARKRSGTRRHRQEHHFLRRIHRPRRRRRPHPHHRPLLGPRETTPAKLLHSIRRSTSLSLTSTTTKSASLSVSSSFIPIPGMPSTPTSKSATKSKAKLSLWQTTAHSSKSLPA